MLRFSRWFAVSLSVVVVAGAVPVAVLRAVAPRTLAAIDQPQAESQSTVANPQRGNVPPIQPIQIVNSDQTAERTREEFMTLMRKFAPALRQVFKLDPSLINNANYIAPYPALVQYLQQHPEIQRNPVYYFEQVSMPENPEYRNSYYNQSSSSRLISHIVDGIGILAIFGTIAWAVIWMLKTLVDSRRWNKLSKVQADAHNKLLDRFSANSELISYIESPAGQKFLQAAPIEVGSPAPKRFGAPFGRILWSVQAGVVLAAAGWAFRLISGNVEPDAVQSFQALGTLGIFLGLGFVVSAAISYVLSKQLGLLEPMAPAAPPIDRTFGAGRGTPGA